MMRFRFRRKTVLWVAFGVVGILFSVHIFGDFIFRDPFTEFIGDENSAEWESMLNTNTKVILLYTTIFHQPIWHGIKGAKLHSYFKDYGCEYDNCLITYNRQRLERADAVIFHVRDLEYYRNYRYSADKLRKLRNNVPSKQKWILLSHENPYEDINLYKPFDGLFNWTSTFSRSSDVFFPYNVYKKLPKNSAVAIRNYAQEKTGLVAWAVSHCNLMRHDYALELQKYIHLTVYGKCRHFFNNKRSCKHFNEKCNKEISSYKFFLAFENNFCRDYVTEKYWERILQNSVPVVMGATYGDGNNDLVIPGSYIDAGKFDSIKALSDYLHYLDSNDTAYNEYFAWKQTYTLDERNSLYCKICKALHSEMFRKQSILDLSKVYSKQKTCDGPYGYIKEQFRKQIEKSRLDTEALSSWITSTFYKPFVQLRILIFP